jgi:hypothetical protein
MKIHLAGIFALVLFLLGCANTPVSTPILEAVATQVPFVATPIDSTATVTVLPTLTVTLPNSTTTPSEKKESDFELPPDCANFDTSIDPIYYHDLSDGACDNPALSPDGSYVAFASFAKPHSDIDSEKIIQEARLFSKSLSQSYPIYASRCGVLYSEWTPMSYLVISDFSQDVGCEYTAIFDTTKNEIIAMLDGAVHRGWRNYWSADKNSFFTLSPHLFGPECSETLSGFDFLSKKSIPTIAPLAPNTNIYVVVGDPIWAPDNKNLFAVIRDGTCSDAEKDECVYRNSYIISIDFTGATPTVSYPFYDPATDYSFTKSPNGILEINSSPTKEVNCWDVHLEESK